MMPTLIENHEMWNNKFDWSVSESEWSSVWSDAYTQWYNTLLPRIYAFIPTGTILEIAPGYGRWTQFLVDKCQHLILVDLSEKCIQACKERFSHYKHITYYVNDGKSLGFIANETVDFVFSFDSLVHAEDDVIQTYLHQLTKILTKDGAGFIHHSNLGEHQSYLSLISKIPYRIRKMLAALHLIETFEIQWRASSMSAKKFEQYTDQAGLQCISQEVINWQSKQLIDCISVVARVDSRLSRDLRMIRNQDFMSEAKYSADLARLYGNHR
jgi:SAM-dependent methyltransferase